MPALAASRCDQLERFSSLKGGFASRWESVRGLDVGPWILEEWLERNEPLERALLPEPPGDFLRHPSILYSMFVGERYLAPELPAVASFVGDDRVPRVLAEDPVGDPPCATIDGAWATSANLVHHAHHLVRFARSTGASWDDLDVVVEWGGGYGSLARVLARLRGSQPTHVIVDTPLFSCVQWLWLSCVLGADRVDLHTAPGRAVRPGVVSLVPVPLVPSLGIEDVDVLVSTWALNESSQHAQDHVVDRDWFGARHLLLGMHDGVPLGDRAQAAGARPEPVGPWMPGQRYLLR